MYNNSLVRASVIKKRDFIKRYREFRRVWLNCDEFEAANDLVLEFFDELEDYLGIPMGN